MVDLLVLTSCLNPPKQDFLKLNNTSERYNQTIECLKFYIESKTFKKIVICDGSNYDLSSDDIILYAKNHEVQLEALHFQQNFDKVKELGKGYGEGEIMRYIIFNSILYKNCDSFIKITGRLKVLNINEIVPKLKADRDYFNFFPSKKIGCLDTRIYKIRRFVYESFLLDSYKRVDDRNHSSYEYCFTDDLKLNNIHPYSFPDVPIISGFSGTTNTPYKKDNYYYLENCLTKLGLMNTYFAGVAMLGMYAINKMVRSISK